MATNERGDRQPSLAGKRVLLIEDEYYIADDVQRILLNAGATVVGPVATLALAHAALDDGAFDCAILDLNLQGESAVSLGDRLAAEGCSFVIATGYGSAAIPERLMDVQRIEKPFDNDALLDLIEKIPCARVGA